MQSGLITNVISPNSIKIRVLYSSDFWTDTPFLCVLCFFRVKYDSENSLLTSSLVHSPFPLNAILHSDWPKKEPLLPGGLFLGRMTKNRPNKNPSSLETGLILKMRLTLFLFYNKKGQLSRTIRLDKIGTSL
jgi:hypothetical protein